MLAIRAPNYACCADAEVAQKPVCTWAEERRDWVESWLNIAMPGTFGKSRIGPSLLRLCRACRSVSFRTWDLGVGRLQSRKYTLKLVSNLCTAQLFKSACQQTTEPKTGACAGFEKSYAMAAATVTLCQQTFSGMGTIVRPGQVHLACVRG